MRVFFFRKSNLGRGIRGLVFLGLLAFVFFQLLRAPLGVVPAQAIYQGNSGQKAVALCVNVDWGEELLPPMLKAFQAADSKVTFFVTGRWAEKNPDLIRQMDKQGHSIQNHGYKHLHFNNLGSEQTREQIIKGGEIIKELTGKESGYFAPPYGEFNNNLVIAAEDLDYKLIMWSIDTIDWQKPAAVVIIKRVMNQLHNDAIILMHPTAPTVEALPELLGQIKAAGYQIKTLDQIIIDDGEKKDKNETEVD